MSATKANLPKTRESSGQERKIKPPAVHPCGSCPYRRDVPSGVWADEEYDKLPEYDKDTAYQPPGVFLCHQQNGCICAGWAATHDMDENLALRIAAMSGSIEPDDYELVINYSTPTELFDSGEEAAAHGRAEIEQPGDKARKAIDKLTRKQERRRR